MSDQNPKSNDMPKVKPGSPIQPCTEAPTIRAVDPKLQPYKPTPTSEGYTSQGHIKHFLQDREVNIAKLNKALVDVFGEPGLRGMRMELEIDSEYWKQICGDPWSGNVYKYNF